MALEDFKAEMERCSNCSYCRWIPLDQIKSRRFARGCPSVSHRHFNSYSARGRYAVALSLLKGKSGYTPQVQDIVFQCQACGSCDVACKITRYNLEPLETILALRAKLAEDGQSPPAHREVIACLRREHNTLQMPKAKRGDWARGLNVKILEGEKAEVVFHAGCQFSYDPDLQQTARTAVTLIQNAGVDVGILSKEETCCGARAFSMGHREASARCARRLMKAWTRAGVKQVVTSCADCYHGFKRLFPRHGSDVEVLHTVEFLDRLIKAGRLKFTRPVPLTVTYHDPCHLGRQGEPYLPWEGVEKKIKGQIIAHEPRRPRNNGAWGVYTPPRDVLESIPGIRLVEMERIREYAWCCGAGGGVKEAYPEFSQWTARDRLAEARSTGAEAIVTACPWCERNFTDAQQPSSDKINVLDIVDLVQQAL